ncbi:MAG: cysteine peptidase family C39 domain-containing protein [bacterium]
MKIKLPIKKQKKKSLHCCVVCLQMVMEYFGEKVPMEELLKQIKVYKNIGTWIADEGKIALKYGFKTFFCYHNSYILDKDTENLSEKDITKLKKYLKDIKRKKYKEPGFKKREIKKDIEYIQLGGKFSTKVPNLDLIDGFLKKKVPVIVTLNTNSLRGQPDKRSGHCVVIIGKEGNNYIVNDPRPEYPKPYKLNKDKLLHAWYLRGAYLLALYK